MSDIYVRDTESALETFADWFDDGFKGSIHPSFQDAHNTLLSEIESLIYEYKEKITKIEELQEELEELKEGK
jgi:hypothetical protein